MSSEEIITDSGSVNNTENVIVKKILRRLSISGGFF